MTALKILLINAPASKHAVEKHHHSKDVSKLYRDFGQEVFVKQQVCAEKDEKYRHSRTHEEHRVAEGTAVADAVVGWHEQEV